MNDPDITDAIIERLREQCDFATLDNAWFAEPLERFGEETPACLVYLAEDSASGQAETLRPIQPVTMVYGVWLVCPEEQFKAKRGEIRRALFGHTFGEAFDPMEYQAGKVADIRGRFVWWREFWTVDTRLRK
ncbi:hypothetical protein MRB56_12665 [Halomonas cupida]|uniref:phage tail terminator protein n=1 Tax=Halomonas cupida TaxID=44933 RepID=UPI0039B61075